MGQVRGLRDLKVADGGPGLGEREESLRTDIRAKRKAAVGTGEGG